MCVCALLAFTTLFSIIRCCGIAITATANTQSNIKYRIRYTCFFSNFFLFFQLPTYSQCFFVRRCGFTSRNCNGFNIKCRWELWKRRAKAVRLRESAPVGMSAIIAEHPFENHHYERFLATFVLNNTVGVFFFFLHIP